MKPRDEFLVLASDGVYDVMSSQMVVNFVRRKLREHSDVQQAAGQLVQKASLPTEQDRECCQIINLTHAAAGDCLKQC